MDNSELHISLPDTKLFHKENYQTYNSSNFQKNEEQPFYSYYINPCFNVPSSFLQSKENLPQTTLSPSRQLPASSLREALTEMALSGKWTVSETPYGLIMSFENKEDAEYIFEKMAIAKVLEGPVQVATLPNIQTGSGNRGDNRKNPGGGNSYNIGRYNININQMSPHASPRNYNYQTQYRVLQPPGPLLIRDVPWSITTEELRAALYKSGYQITSIERWRQHIRIEVKNISHYEQLISEGFNFYNCGRFAVSGERPGSSGSGHNDVGIGNGHTDDVLQCYRCQGFWHVAANCRHLPRCVRCGEPHGVEYCTRARNNPICCNCSGAHHAAYKNCPVRKDMAQSAPIAFVLSRDRPTGSFAEVTADASTTKPRCML